MKTVLVLLKRSFLPTVRLHEYKWFYLGADSLFKEKVASVYGKDKKLNIGDSLHKIALEQRQLFLNFIAQTSEEQTDLLNWWAGRLPSRVSYQTDFFLLFCYRVLFHEIANLDYRNMVLIVEDPWLFESLRQDYKSRGDIRFVGRANLRGRKALLFLRGLAARLYWVFKLAFLYHKTAWNFSRNKIKEARFQGIAINSYAEARAFSNQGSYADPYWGSLFEYLKQKGLPVYRTLNFPCPARWMSHLRGLWREFWPLALDMKAGDLLWSMRKFWRPKIDWSHAWINDYCVELLLKREIAKEYGSSAFNLNLLFYRIMVNFFKKNICSHFVYLFENQPWEKMLCLAARQAGNVRLVGHQHSTVPHFELNHFLGINEQNHVPLPDCILTASRYATELLVSGGMPKNKVRLSGSWRYTYLFDKTLANRTVNKTSAKRILAIVPLNKNLGKAFLTALSTLLADRRKNSCEVTLKCHPHSTFLQRDGFLPANRGGFRVTSEPVSQLWDQVDTVIYSEGTVAFEGLWHGKNLIHWNAECLLSMDPFSYEECPQWYEGENGFEALEKAFSADDRRGRIQKQDIFNPIDCEVWHEELVKK